MSKLKFPQGLKYVCVQHSDVSKSHGPEKFTFLFMPHVTDASATAFGNRCQKATGANSSFLDQVLLVCTPQ